MVGMQVRLTCDRVVDATYIYLVEAIGGGAVVQTEASVLELDMPSSRSKPFRGEVPQGRTCSDDLAREACLAGWDWEAGYRPSFLSVFSRSLRAFDALRAPPPSSFSFTECPREQRTVRWLATSSSVKRTFPPQSGHLVSILSAFACPPLAGRRRPWCARPPTVPSHHGPLARRIHVKAVAAGQVRHSLRSVRLGIEP